MHQIALQSYNNNWKCNCTPRNCCFAFRSELRTDLVNSRVEFGWIRSHFYNIRSDRIGSVRIRSILEDTLSHFSRYVAIMPAQDND